MIDADGAVLGRLAAQVADILRGKNKPVYTPHLDAGDFVVVVNAEKVRLTGKKETAKEFMTYSGWKGGEKYTTVAQIRARHPEKLVLHAVKGMIPKNRLGSQLLTKLKVFKGPKHPHAAQKPEPLKAAACFDLWQLKLKTTFWAPDDAKPPSRAFASHPARARSPLTGGSLTIISCSKPSGGRLPSP